MIKGLTLLRSVPEPAARERLRGFFAALGFEPGPDADSFRAPLGAVSLGSATSELPQAELLVEVTALASIREAAAAWLGGGEKLTPVEPTSWGAELFTAEPVAGFPVAFWQWADPLRGKPAALEGDLVATGMRFAVVLARWNAVITDRLLQGAMDCLLRSGARREDVEIVRVPGAWEIPDAARKLAATGRFHAVVTLGVLLRGETAHYEAIYNEVARGIGQSQAETGVPHAFGVLTCETLEQALDRAGLKAGNKGFEAASAAIEMASLHAKIEAPR